MPVATGSRDRSSGAEPIEEISILWLTAGLSCDGDTIAMTGATQPSIEDVLAGVIPRDAEREALQSSSGDALTDSTKRAGSA